MDATSQLHVAVSPSSVRTGGFVHQKTSILRTCELVARLSRGDDELNIAEREAVL